MNSVVMILSAVISVVVVIYMLIKKMDIKITLLLIGVILMFISMAMGNGISMSDFESTGLFILDPLLAIVNQFKSTLVSSGLIILLLGGYSAYMTAIGANNVTVSVMTKPIKKVKSPYVLVPIVFLLGNLLSLVIPSASNLAVILLATLFPILVQSGMSTLTAAAVIATTATVTPTPLGSDNVAIAQELAKYASDYPIFSGMTVTDYVFKYHAIISIPTIFVMAAVHFFWQKHLDKKRGIQASSSDVKLEAVKEIHGGTIYRITYALLPLLPVILLVIVFALQSITGISISLSVEVAALLSFAIAIICELLRNKDKKAALDGTESFFKGMGFGIPTVALLVSASVFVTGLKSIGLIDSLQSAMLNMQGGGLSFVLPLILVLVTALIVLLSGSGTALFFAMVPLMVPLAQAAGINPLAIAVPMGLAGNLFRAVSPVSAVTVIVAGSVKKSPMEVAKGASLPMLAGVVFMFVMSMVLFL